MWHLDPMDETLLPVHYITDSWISMVRRHFKDNVRFHVQTNQNQFDWNQYEAYTKHAHFSHSVFCCFLLLLCFIAAHFCLFVFSIYFKALTGKKDSRDFACFKWSWVKIALWFYIVSAIALVLFRDDHQTHWDEYILKCAIICMQHFRCNIISNVMYLTILILKAQCWSLYTSRELWCKVIF